LGEINDAVSDNDNDANVNLNISKSDFNHLEI